MNNKDPDFTRHSSEEDTLKKNKQINTFILRKIKQGQGQKVAETDIFDMVVREGFFREVILKQQLNEVRMIAGHYRQRKRNAKALG